MLDHDKTEKVKESLDILLSLQRRFQEENGFENWKGSGAKRREMFVRTLFATISELCEAGDEVNKWWKKGCREDDSLDRKREEILEEMIDALHFYLCALLILGVDGKGLADAYLKKLKVNFDRQKDGSLGYV